MFDVSKVKKIDFEDGTFGYLYSGDLNSDELKEFKKYTKEMDVTKMTNKFTEEQYQKIIKAWRSENTYVHQTEAVIDYLIDDLNVDVTLMGDIVLAIANPLTREWAHDNFVEKEKEFYWKLKDNLEFGLASDGIVINIGLNKKSKLTESVIKAWGYNPEMFDKKEV